MKRPAFQFYPDNWRNNSNLRRCSWAARGVWIEVMCLMHDSEEYGALPWTLKEIAQALGCPMPALRELVDKGVLKGCDQGACKPFIYVPRSGRKDGDPVILIDARQGPFWYSSRMVRDEYVRTIRGEATRFTDAPNPTPKGGIGAAPKAAPSGRQSDGSSTPSPTSYSSEATPLRGKTSPTHRGSRLPSDWQPTADDAAAARAAGVDLATTAAKFRDYWHAKTGANATKLDWAATWRNWCRSEAERQQRRPQGSTAQGRRAAGWQRFVNGDQPAAPPAFDLDLTADGVTL